MRGFADVAAISYAEYRQAELQQAEYQQAYRVVLTKALSGGHL
jgi:hypothetical protein